MVTPKDMRGFKVWEVAPGLHYDFLTDVPEHQRDAVRTVAAKLARTPVAGEAGRRSRRAWSVPK